MSGGNVDALRGAIGRLSSRPADLGAWFDIANALAEAGDKNAASDALARLGDAASKLGQVALAVACVRKLDALGSSDKARPLVDAIGALHCRSAAEPTRGPRTRPPAPPAPEKHASAALLPPGTSVKALQSAATDAIAVAERSARDRAPDVLPSTPLVRGLDAPDFRELVSVAKLSLRKMGSVIVDVGQPARSLFWIARGAATATRDGVELGQLYAGAFFGEIALVGATTRTARVACGEDTWLLEIPAAALESLAGKAPKLGRVLARYARARLLANVMRTSELFSRITEQERSDLLPMFETRLVAAGTRVIEDGGFNDSLMVVVSGRCEVREGDEVRASLVVGDAVGEMSLMSRDAAVADVVATEQTVFLCLSRSAFDVVADKHPGLLAEVYKLAVARKRANRDALIHEADELIV